MRQEPGNALLASLSDEQWSSWRPLFEPVRMGLAQQVLCTGEASPSLWFPTGGVYCQTLETGEGASIDVAAIGREGVIGLPALFGVPSAVQCKVLTTPAAALAIPLRTYQEHATEEPVLGRRLMRYAGARLAALAQVAACNRLHHSEQRLCRWLLTVSARAGSARIMLTQELISLMLGTRRAAITEALGGLTNRGLIRRSRGIIEIADFAALRECTCECFEIIEELYRRAAMDPL